MHKVWWYLIETTVHLTTSLPSKKNKRRIEYDMPGHNELQYK